MGILLDRYEDLALINAVNDASSDFEKYIIKIFSDPDITGLYNHYRFDVGYKWNVSRNEDNDEELKKAKDIVNFLNSCEFYYPSKYEESEKDEKGIPKAKYERLETKFSDAIAKLNKKKLMK